MQRMRWLGLVLISLATVILCSWLSHAGFAASVDRSLTPAIAPGTAAIHTPRKIAAPPPKIAQANLCGSGVVTDPLRAIDTDGTLYDVIYDFSAYSQAHSSPGCGREYWTPISAYKTGQPGQIYAFFYLIDGLKNRVAADAYIENADGQLLTYIFLNGNPPGFDKPDPVGTFVNPNSNPATLTNPPTSSNASSGGRSAVTTTGYIAFTPPSSPGERRIVFLRGGATSTQTRGLTAGYPTIPTTRSGQTSSSSSTNLSGQLYNPISLSQATAVVGNGSPASCTEAALDTAIAKGGIIAFNCGSSPFTILVTKEKAIATKTLIDGGGLITLSGGGTTRVLSTTNNGIELTLQNIAIADGYTSGEGAGLRSGYQGKLTLANCSFANNVSTAGGQFDGGGAVYISSESTATVYSCTFTSNAANNGGAINNLLSDLTVSNSTFIGNQSRVSGSGGGGGAIYVDGAGSSGKIAISSSQFSNNSAILQGGALFLFLYGSNSASIDSTTIANNAATGSSGFGGGVYMNGQGGNNVTIASSTINSNSATSQGGGIWMNSVSLNLNNSVVKSNQAVSGGLGGGIMRVGGSGSISGTTITGNFAGGQGGGIFNASGLSISSSNISGNSAVNGYNDVY